VDPVELAGITALSAESANCLAQIAGAVAAFSVTRRANLLDELTLAREFEHLGVMVLVVAGDPDMIVCIGGLKIILLQLDQCVTARQRQQSLPYCLTVMHARRAASLLPPRPTTLAFGFYGARSLPFHEPGEGRSRVYSIELKEALINFDFVAILRCEQKISPYISPICCVDIFCSRLVSLRTRNKSELP
jgi:hypothetical protein